jgi:WxL domain surface cell wall-binding
MFEFKRRTLGIGFGLVMMAILAMGSASIAFADGPVVTANLGAGTLTEVSGVVTWTTPVTAITGAAQDAVYTFPITVDDATGSALGWNLTITSTTFTGASHALSANASTISGAAITPGTGTAPVASTVAPVVYAGLVLPGASATAVRFFSAQANSGMGSSTITPTVHIAIPADALADTYVSTITVASVSAP